MELSLELHASVRQAVVAAMDDVILDDCARIHPTLRSIVEK
ncbi:hypothetical protein V7O66_06120 [Methanolobus sp. ZRKC3]